MFYKSYYNSPLGKILLVSKSNKLVGLWLEGQKYYLGKIKDDLILNDEEPILLKTKLWLDDYFNEKKPDINRIELDLIGTDFQKMVWEELLRIPYGKVITYKEVAIKIAKKLNKKVMSFRAVGSAVGKNPISIIIPCHRVIGSNGKLTGYAGGIDKKIKLLEHEGIKVKNKND